MQNIPLSCEAPDNTRDINGTAMKLYIKRIYETPSDDDGARILIDRLWPRGISKDKARLTLWLKEIAPSDELRHWFNHEAAKWDEFRRRYREELDANPRAVKDFFEAAKEADKITLLYGARDEEHNQAVVLREYL